MKRDPIPEAIDAALRGLVFPQHREEALLMIVTALRPDLAESVLAHGAARTALAFEAERRAAEKRGEGAGAADGRPTGDLRERLLDAIEAIVPPGSQVHLEVTLPGKADKIDATVGFAAPPIEFRDVRLPVTIEGPLPEVPDLARAAHDIVARGIARDEERAGREAVEALARDERAAQRGWGRLPAPSDDRVLGPWEGGDGRWFRRTASDYPGATVERMHDGLHRWAVWGRLTRTAYHQGTMDDPERAMRAADEHLTAAGWLVVPETRPTGPDDLCFCATPRTGGS